jgi:exopolysaccharide production protein ExoZ
MSEKRTLNALQALRGCAALLVVCDHSFSIAIAKGGVAPNPDLVSFGNFLGALGVAVFFAISGFVMMYAHGDDFGRRGTPLRFANRRIGRIVPIYWVITAIFALKLTAFDHLRPSLGAVGQSFAFIPFTLPGDAYGRPILGQGWTLNYEAFFYLVFGVALLLRRGLWIVFAVFAALVVAHLLGATGHNNPMAFWGDPIVLYFLAGLGLGMLRQRAQAPFGFYGAIGCTIVALAFAAVAASVLGPNSMVAQVLMPIGAIAAVGACVLATERPIAKAPQWFAKTLGDATYSIYLTHTLVISVIAKALVHKAHLPLATFAALMLPVTVVFGVAVYFGLERRLIRAWAAIFRPPQDKPPALGQSDEAAAHA